MRNKYLGAELLQQSMKLKQMGAEVAVINSKLCYVTFDVSGFTVSYVYNVNKKGKYFLERIRPYSLPLKEFESEDDVIAIIEMDLSQFKNAIKSHNIDQFISVSRRLERVFHQFEDLFLYYNVPEDEMKRLEEEVAVFEKDIAGVKEKAQRVFHEKEPEFLK